MIKINVTWKDIHLGNRCDLDNCATSLALKRVIKEKNIKVRYNKTDYYIEINNKKYDKSKIQNYEELKTFINKFDFGLIGDHGAKPFDFAIEL